jgi:hypothetical protein
MKTKYAISNVGIGEIKNLDLLIVASGYEHRASYLAQKLPCVDIKNKVVFSFKDHSENPVRKNNDIIFSDLGFVSEHFSGNNWENIQKILIQFFNDICDKGEVNILVDYSSMTRLWYATILKYITSYCNYKGIINLYFAYTKAEYSRPSDSEINFTVNFDPLPGYNKLSIPDKPTALIIGLGYEKARATGLIEYFDAQEVFLFYADNPLYHDKIKEANGKLLENYSNNIFIFPLNDIVTTKTILENLCNRLSSDYRIVITPCGPKPFTLVSFLLAIENQNIDTWRVSGSAIPNQPECYPSGDFIVTRLEIF